MNSTFKVVFNKARGALMVVNEVTSSVQGKGTKTVVAAAVATMLTGVAGSAMAAEWQDVPKDLTVATDTVITDDTWDQVQNENAFVLQNGTKPWASLKKEQTFDKTLWVTGAGSGTHASGFGVSGENVTFTNKGTIYVTSGKDGVNYQNDAIWAGNGATAINDGKIVAKDAYGMRVGKDGNASKIVNNGSIYVESTGAGMELGGAANSEAVNNGLISVGDVNTESSQNLEFGHGVLIQDQEGAKFTNNGTITAGKDASAIEIKKIKADTSAEINLGEKSQIDGLINIGANTTVVLNAKGMSGKLQVKAADGTTTLNIESGSDVTLADRQGSVYESVNIADGKLTASIWHDANEYGEQNEQLQNDNKFKNVTVGEKGVFNITKLNSGGDTDQTSAEAKPHTQLLIKDMKLTLDGGALQVAGQNYTGALKVGVSSDSGADTLTINAGNYNFESLKVGNARNNVVTVAGGSLTVGDVEIKGNRHGKLSLTGGTTTVNGSFTTVQGAIELNGGTLVTAGSNLFSKGEGADAKYGTTDAWKHVTATTGVVELTDTGFEYSLADLRKGQELLKQDNSVKLVLNGTLKLEGEELNAGAVSGLNLAGHTGVAVTNDDGKVFAVTQTTTIGAINFSKVTDEEATEITLGNTAALTLAGNGGDVFKNLGAKVTTVTTGDLVLGTAGNSGNVNVDKLVATDLTVAGDFTARAVEANNAQIDGMLTADSLAVNGNGTAVVAGALALTGNIKEGASELSGKVNVTGTGLLTTNKAAANAYIAQLDDEEPSAVLYVDRAMKLADGAEIVIGNATPQTIALLANGDAAPAANASVKVQEGGYALVDVSNFIGSGEAVFGGNAAVTVGNNAALDLINVNKTGEVKLGDSVTVDNGGELDTDSLYIGVDAEKGFANGVVTLKYFGNIVADKTVDARLAALFAKGASAKEMAILNELQADKFIQEDANGHASFNALGNKAFEQATGGNATAGVLNVAYDANAQVTDAIVRHQLSEHAGMGVWADVFYAKNEAKELYGDFGYSADIYGGVLGFDYTAACGGTLGAALTIGTADADSEGGVLSNSLSSDFVGLSVYASKDFSGLNVKADLGYIDFSNDFTGLGDASDATTITFGVRGDFTAYRNGAFSVVPHMGLRYTRIHTDAVAFNDEQNMNVLEAPIGVKFAGTFEATGWKLVPSYDFTIVPQLGDKEVEAFGTAGDITILSGGLFNNVLGVEAVKDNMSFGLNASYGFGPDDRANTQVNANFRYHF